MPFDRLRKGLCIAVITAFISAQAFAGEDVLRVGIAGHAFDHLGDIADQADAAAASGANIIYCTGVGGFGYAGLPEAAALEKARQDSFAYTKRAKSEGIKLAIGYVCATSIVGLKTFDAHWTPQFRAKFHTPPAEWRQQDRHGNPLHSWYGSAYEPACMNNPDWRAYEKAIVRMQLEAGCDGIFFDNPTVHDKGCFCPFCMEKFGAFMAGKADGKLPKNSDLETLRSFAASHPREFMEFRSGIARDFLAEIRAYARSIKRGAFITCNNSLNSPNVLFDQCRRYAYDIDELSKAEDWITVEDMSSQPRMLANGQTMEYGPTYKQLRAISHGKPVVAVTVAEADYHTAPDLVRLAMAEAAANGASYLSWPTWPVNERQHMISIIRPEADFLRANEQLLNDVKPRCDVAVLLSFRRWLDTGHCKVSDICAALAKANIQVSVISGEEIESALKNFPAPLPTLIIEQRSLLDEAEKRAIAYFEKHGGKVVEANTPDWLLGGLRTLSIKGPSTIRAMVADQRKRTIVHIYNLGVERLSSYEDRVHPANDIRVSVHVPFTRVKSVTALTADGEATSGALDFQARPGGKETIVDFKIPRVEIGTMVMIE